jgi:hypothetical protein
LDYLLDFAEIPTLVAMQDADHEHDGVTSAAEWDAYAERWATALPGELTLNAEQRALALQRQKITWRLRAGAGRPAAAAHARRIRRATAVGVARARALHRPFTSTGCRLARALGHERGRRPHHRDHRGAVGSQPALDGIPSLVGDLPNETSTAIEVALNPAGVAATRVDRPNAHAAAATASLPAAGLWSLFRLGTHHIATGWDHLVFLLGLLLLSQSLRDLIKIVTAFTLAHSLTLGLAAAGLVTPPGSLIEPLIALTIAYVGLANLRFRAHAHGMPIAFCFGLIHGFGFAGALGATLSGTCCRRPQLAARSGCVQPRHRGLSSRTARTGGVAAPASAGGAVGGDGASRCRLQRARCRDLVVCLARQWIVGSRAGASKTNAPRRSPMKRELLLALSAAVLLVAGNARAVTPAERQIAEAREAVAAQPTAASGYTGLALALARRAREVSSYAYYDEASAALDRAQALALTISKRHAPALRYCSPTGFRRRTRTGDPPQPALSRRPHDLRPVGRCQRRTRQLCRSRDGGAAHARSASRQSARTCARSESARSVRRH